MADVKATDTELKNILLFLNLIRKNRSGKL
jgi:hypothetical protein